MAQDSARKGDNTLNFIQPEHFFITLTFPIPHESFLASFWVSKILFIFNCLYAVY